MARVDALGNPVTCYRAESVDAITGGGKLKGVGTRQVHYRRKPVRRSEMRVPNRPRCVGDAGRPLARSTLRRRPGVILSTPRFCPIL